MQQGSRWQSGRIMDSMEETINNGSLLDMAVQYLRSQGIAVQVKSVQGGEE